MFQKPVVEAHIPEQESYSDDTVQTVVGPSVHVEGDFSSEGNILVKGSVAGNVRTSKQLTVEEGAKISANVLATNAIISGEIHGNVKVAQKLELTSTAKIVGDIICEVLAVDAGALMYGKVMMKKVKIEEASKSSSKTKSRKKTVDQNNDEETDI